MIREASPSYDVFPVFPLTSGLDDDGVCIGWRMLKGAAP
jgi:hypothetical protein